MRIKRATKLNVQSSRSHCLFQIVIESDKADQNGMLKRAKLNIGDLAGSEKLNTDDLPDERHINELKNINKSLTTFGKIIQILSSGKKEHIPYRESKLTRLLEDSLGGNTRTCLIATLSPTIDHLDDSISTLKFAERAKCIQVKVSKNEILAVNDELVKKL